MSQEQLAAIQLLEESDLLRGDEYARRVVESGGQTEAGVLVDLGNFLSAREAVIESTRAAAKVTAAMDKDRSAWEVANSVKPEIENYE